MSFRTEVLSTAMTEKRYYSARTGKNPLASRFDLTILAKMFKDLYTQYQTEGFFQEYFGYWCIDEGDKPGKLGSDIEFQLLKKLRKPDLWPIKDKFTEYSEDDVFDLVEFLYDHISKPIDGWEHTYCECGWHYSTFDKGLGREEYRSEINQILQDYGEGYELSVDGEILALADEGLSSLLDAELPVYDPANVENRVSNAKLKYLRRSSSLDDRRDALRDLADVLEFLRPKLKSVITKTDEGDLFNIANNFGIRHHNDAQKTDYDKKIWYSWIYYYYLATIHAAVRLIQKQEQSGDN